MSVTNNIVLKILLMFFSFILLSCGPSTKIYSVRGYYLKEALTATVGSTMMDWDRVKRMRNTWGEEWNAEGVRKELIYSGISGEVIFINYREFYLDETGAFARQAFYQEVKYDISKSKLITFQDIKIEVESADQEKIRYRIIKGPVDDAPSRWE